MGRSLSRSATLPNGKVTGAFGTVTSRRENGAIIQVLHARGFGAAYSVRYSVGTGLVGFSFLVRVGDALFQSPVSYYSRASKWDLTPGYEQERIPDFTHRVSEGCLFCHVGAANLKAGSTDRFATPELEPIGCERCHGDVVEHLKSPRPRSIVNPAKLPAAQRDSVCEQCHLEGDARVLNPGRHWFDFRPGGLTENVFATYLLESSPLESRKGAESRAVSQSELLAQSRCFRESKGRLWCGTCHRPHGTVSRQQRSMKDTCLSCHPTITVKAGHPREPYCVSCHMPRLRPTDVPHSSTTNHQITVPNAKRRKVVDCAAQGCVQAWRAPAADLDRRDRALALFQIAAAGPGAMAKEELAQPYEILSALYKEGSHDPEVISTLASILLQQNHPDLAVKLYGQAIALASDNARLHYLAGESLRIAGKPDLSAKALRRSIALDPTAPDPYLSLEKLYSAAGRRSDARAVLDEYLRFLPQSVLFRERLRALH